MEKELVKKAVEEAEQSLQNKQIEEVKKIVIRTLERIKDLDKEINDTKNEVKELEDKRKILKMDIDDLKNGRLDLIAERQEKDPKAKNISVVIIIKEKEIIREVSPWYFPYQVIWQQPYLNVYPLITQPTIYCTSGGGTSCITSGSSTISINNSLSKFATLGTYNIEGEVINLR